MSKRIFISGTSTDVGKTWASAIVCKSLNADYFKPVQTGFPEHSDTAFLQTMVQDPQFKIHLPGLTFRDPLSPHAAAANEGRDIVMTDIKFPETENTLIYEGAGGLLVPLNDQDLIADLIQPGDYVILVSRHYLGSINHTLLSLDYLKQKGVENVGILFSGAENPSTESIIKKMGKVDILGRIPELEGGLSPKKCTELATQFKTKLENFIGK